MDLLIEKLDGSRYYLSQYKVLVTDFEESAPSVTRNNMQLDQRNGNIDFGGWHTDKTINITGYYRADDIDEEETLREKLYALLSDHNGYYITQLKTVPSVAMERPGETSGGYYDKLSNYPSHKRFLVYTEAPEMELVGNVNGALLYKLTAEFKTMKLPYGESMQQDLDIKPNVPYYFSDVGLERDSSSQGISGKPKTDGKTPYLHTAYSWSADGTDRFMTVYPGENLWSDKKAVSYYIAGGNGLPAKSIAPDATMLDPVTIPSTATKLVLTIYNPNKVVNTLNRAKPSFFKGDTYLGIQANFGLTGDMVQKEEWSIPAGATKAYLNTALGAEKAENFDFSIKTKYEFDTATPYTPSISDDPEGAYPKFIGTYTDYIADDSTDPSKYTWALIKTEDGNDGLSGYNKWYFDTYYNTNNLAIPYAGTVPCNQLEQGFAIELTAKEASSSLSLKIDDTELTYSDGVASGDVFMFSGFSYTKNGLSIVSKTNKAYFILQPDKPNRITCNVPGTVRIIGFQNLYA